MKVFIHFPPSPALLRRLKEMQDAAGPNGRATNRVKGDLAAIVVEDNTEKLLGRGLLEGVDRFGRPLAPMAPSTFKNPRRGLGPVLVPRGLLSRFITHFKAEWRRGVLVMGWQDILSKDGRSFVEYHLAGAPLGSKPGQPNWSLPQRDVAGITPAGWAKIVARHAKFAADVLRRGSS